MFAFLISLFLFHCPNTDDLFGADEDFFVMESSREPSVRELLVHAWKQSHRSTYEKGFSVGDCLIQFSDGFYDLSIIFSQHLMQIFDDLHDFPIPQWLEHCC